MQRNISKPENDLAQQLLPFMEALAAHFAASGSVDKYGFEAAFKEFYSHASKRKSNKNLKTNDAESTSKISYKSIIESLPNHLDIQISGNNNLNLHVTSSKEIKVVMQFSKKRDIECDNILKKCSEDILNKSPEPALDYIEPIHLNIRETQIQQGTKVKPKEIPQGVNITEDEYIVVRCIESCSKSIENEIKAINKLIEKEADAIKIQSLNNRNIQLAIRSGKFLANFLKFLSEADIIWTDMKYNNLLISGFRFVIPDTKAFTRVSQINFSYFPMGNKLRSNLEITPELLSEAQDKLFFACEKDADLGQRAEEARQQLKAIWEREYHYQIAILIYYILTGKAKFTDMLFDFSHAVFNNVAGKKMQHIIEGLSKHEIHYSYLASEEFSKINLDLMDDELANVATRNKSTSSPSFPCHKIFTPNTELKKNKSLGELNQNKNVITVSENTDTSTSSSISTSSKNTEYSEVGEPQIKKITKSNSDFNAKMLKKGMDANEVKDEYPPRVTIKPTSPLFHLFDDEPRQKIPSDTAKPLLHHKISSPKMSPVRIFSNSSPESTTTSINTNVENTGKEEEIPSLRKSKK